MEFWKDGMIPLEYGFHSTGQVERKGNIGINDGILE